MDSPSATTDSRHLRCGRWLYQCTQRRARSTVQAPGTRRARPALTCLFPAKETQRVRPELAGRRDAAIQRLAGTGDRPTPVTPALPNTLKALIAAPTARSAPPQMATALIQPANTTRTPSPQTRRVLTPAWCSYRSLEHAYHSVSPAREDGAGILKLRQRSPR